MDQIVDSCILHWVHRVLNGMRTGRFSEYIFARNVIDIADLKTQKLNS